MDVNEYSIYCVTESNNFTTWNTVEPTTCPNNNTHTIDPSQTTIVGQIKQKEITIKEESVPTQGLYKMIGYQIDVNPGVDTITTFDISFPYRVTILAIVVQPTPTNIGDTFNVVSMPDLVVGATQSNVSAGDTSLTIITPSIDQIKHGLLIKVNGIDCGEIISVDQINSLITFSTPLSSNVIAGSPISITVSRVENQPIIDTTPIFFGEKKIGGSSLPPLTIGRLLYQNKDGVAKKINFRIELLY